MAIAKNEGEFTKLRIKKSTINKLNRIKANQEMKDGKRRSIYQLIDDWAEGQILRISKRKETV